MRRKDREITDYNRMLEILDACDCARLGLIDEAGAYVVPLNFGYEDQEGKLTLYFHGASAGKKNDLIKEQQTASFELDRKHELVEGPIACAFSYMYQCIMGNGNIEIVEEHEEKIHALQKIMAHYSDKQEWEFKEEQVRMVTVFKLEVTGWSCKEH